jgi:ketosteroid isomerase-like protein
MSRENLVDLALRAFDALNRQDVNALLSLADPEVLIVTAVPAVIFKSAYLRHDQLRIWVSDLFAVFPGFKVEALDVRAHGELTFAIWRVDGLAEGTDPPIEKLWHIAKWREGKFVEWREYLTETDALGAAGLME